MEQNHYCVIMAGGVGSRFWPLSRAAKPKQFLDILGTGKTLLRQTFERFIHVIPIENILIVTNTDYGDLVKEQIPELEPANILLEPYRRNTAPCIAYASYKIKKLDPGASIIVAPSDHLIIKEEMFSEVVNQGLEFVSRNDALLTLGIQPSRPETGYGYIQVDGAKKKSKEFKNFRTVKTFTEKPDYKLAKVFYESGEFYWNAGIFFWALPSILEAYNRYLPEMNSIFSEGDDKYNTGKEKAFIENAYSKCRNISIDYGIMEKADNVFVLTSDFGWSDLGTWGSLHEQSVKDKQNNVIRGDNVMIYDVRNCLINVPDNKLVVLQGLKDFIVVESKNALLVCRIKDEQKIKNIVRDVEMQQGGKFI